MNPATLIGRANGVKHLHTSNGNTRDIINAILYADKFCAPYTANAAAALKGRNVEETCYNIWKFWKDHVRYVEDPDGVQYVKSPGYLFELGEGDCKSYSVAIASCLQNLRIPYKYRFISEDASKDLHHVYVVVPTSQGEIIVDCVLDNFNVQNAYAKKKDIAPQRSTAAGINGIGATQAEVVANNWLAFEKAFADNKMNYLGETIRMAEADINAKYPNAPLKRSKARKATVENLGYLIRGGNCLFYLYWDNNVVPLPTGADPLTGVFISSKKNPGADYRDMLMAIGLRQATIDRIAKLACYYVYGITQEYMLYRCYSMVKYGQPWEPTPGIPFYDMINNVFVNQGTTAESLANTVKIGMCFPAAGGIARPFGQPYLSVAGWYIQNGASAADFAKYKQFYIPSDYEKQHIANNGAGLSPEYFAEDYALYLQWLGGNMAALPSITQNVGQGKPHMGGAKIGTGPGLEVGAIVGIVVACIAAISSLIALIRQIVQWAKGAPAAANVPNPPADFHMQYQSIDGCYIGTAPAECGAAYAKYCPDGTFICLTPQQMQAPENQPGTPANGFMDLPDNSKYLFLAGAALLLFGFFSSSKSSAA